MALVAVSFCNARGKAPQPVMAALIHTAFDRIVPIVIPVEQITGGTGLAMWDGKIAMLCQAQPLTKLAFISLEGQVVDLISLKHIRRGHSLVATPTELLGVSTGTDSIWAVSRDGKETLYWQSCDAPNYTLHLNGIALDSRQRVFVCGFGMRNLPSNGERIRTHPGVGIYSDDRNYIRLPGSEPHSPIFVDDDLFFLASLKRELCSLSHSYALPVTGYARGLSCTDDSWWVGSSAIRSATERTKVSSDGAPRGAAVWEIGRKDLKVLRCIDLSDYANEIYDVRVLTS